LWRFLAELAVFFDRLPPDATAIAGGKGASLSRMAAAGMPVPAGFVVTADAFRQFLDSCNGASLIARETAGLDTDDMPAVSAASERIRTAILATPFPPVIADAIRTAHQQLQQDGLVAVRSSAVSEDGASASFAGQQETYLNVHGAAAVLERVRECWSSFFSPRALFYRKQKGVIGDTRMAVVVQEMVRADTSGVMFTVDPIRNRRDCMVIEAAPGLGEAIVSGEVTPDHYVVSRADGSVVDEFIPGEDGERVLRPADLNRLRELGLRLENIFGSPQDVEWCIRGDELHLLQSRPITTLVSHGA
jgi:pyruvate, water dikinase